MKSIFKVSITALALLMCVTACEPENPTNNEAPEQNEQEGGNDEGNQEIDYFDITVSEITQTTAHITVTAKEELGHLWLWDVDMPNKTYDEDYVYKYIDDLYMAALDALGYTESEYPYEDFCSEMFIPAGYTDEYTYSGLEPETEYTVWVCGVDEYGQVMSKIKTYNFTTPAIEMSDMTFTIDIDEDMNLTVIPSDPDETYIYYFGGPDSYKEDGFDSIEDCLNDLAEYICSMGADLLYSGEWTENMKGYLVDGTNYVWVVGYNGGFTTEVFEFSFEYEYIPPGNNTLTEDVTDVQYTVGKGYNLGEYKGTYKGLDYYEFYIYEDSSKDCHTMKLYIFTEPDQEDISGEYEISDTPAAGKAFKGHMNEEGFLAGCHYFYSYTYDAYALLTEGTINISQGENNMFTMDINAKSDDFNVTGHFDGELIIEKVNLE